MGKKNLLTSCIAVCLENASYDIFTLQSIKSPFKHIGFEDGISHMEARYPAILFKQQLTACVEKIFGLIRDNIKKELSPLLGLCIQVILTLFEISFTFATLR